MNTPTPGTTVTLTSDLLHYRDIYQHAQVEHGETTVQLKAGKQLIVTQVFDDGEESPLVECHTPSGAYYQIPVTQLSW